MKNQLKVSVVVPAYNASSWIGRCVTSITEQTYKNLEIIILNDGSTDETLKILRDYELRDERILVIDKKNSGTYSTRLHGYKRSSGEVILNVDADDYLESFAIELLVKKMKDTGADLVLANNYQVLNGRKRIVKNKIPASQDKVSQIKSLLNNEMKGYVWGRLFKKELLSGIKYNIDHLLQEDVLLNLHVIINHDVKIALEPTPIYNYIIHARSANTSRDSVFIENIYGFLDVVEKMLVESNLLFEVSTELKLFKCRNWIVYSRLGGKLAKNKKFRNGFYKANYTSYAKKNLELYQNIEMLTYGFDYNIGWFTTQSMKKLNYLIS